MYRRSVVETQAKGIFVAAKCSDNTQQKAVCLAWQPRWPQSPENLRRARRAALFSHSTAFTVCQSLRNLREPKGCLCDSCLSRGPTAVQGSSKRVYGSSMTAARQCNAVAWQQRDSALRTYVFGRPSKDGRSAPPEGHRRAAVSAALQWFTRDECGVLVSA